MEKIGLYFGSFNPIHIGHLIIANHILEFTDIKKICFIISPHNPIKKKSSLINKNHRYNMINEAIKDFPNMYVSNIEFYLPTPSYTINTLNILEKYNLTYKICIIIGDNSFFYIKKWKDYKKILYKYPIYIYPHIKKIKKSFNKIKNKIIKIKAPIIGISSSFIRKLIKNNKNFSLLVKKENIKYIMKNKLYL